MVRMSASWPRIASPWNGGSSSRRRRRWRSPSATTTDERANVPIAALDSPPRKTSGSPVKTCG
jgi:hypothetical protein